MIISLIDIEFSFRPYQRIAASNVPGTVGPSCRFDTMPDDSFLHQLAHTVSRLFEVAGIVVIVVGTLIAGWILASWRWNRRGGKGSDQDAVTTFRRNLGRSILVGLELLVAADIIRTVAVDPSMESVMVLGVIVAIRTFLSFSLEVEINGRWPWQKKESGTD